MPAADVRRRAAEVRMISCLWLKDRADTCPASCPGPVLPSDSLVSLLVVLGLLVLLKRFSSAC